MLAQEPAQDHLGALVGPALGELAEGLGYSQSLIWWDGARYGNVVIGLGHCTGQDA